MTDIIKYTLTSHGKANRVVEFIRGNSNYFYGIGKATPWPDDSDPPVPSPITSLIEDALLYKRVSIIRPAKIVECPSDKDILCDGRWFRLYDLTDILIDDKYFEIFPTHIYLQAIIRSDDYDDDDFRITGITTNLVPSPGIPTNKSKYLPSEVSSPGLLQWISYSTPIPRVTGKSHKLEFFLEL